MSHMMGFVRSQVYPKGKTWPSTPKGAVECLNHDCEESVEYKRASVIADGQQAWLVINLDTGASYRVYPLMGMWEELDGADVAAIYGFEEV